MAELKTKPTGASVSKFLKAIDDDQIREDCLAVARLMAKITKAKPKMWGTSIVGFGDYHYRYASGQEGDWMLTAFAPRKGKFTVYIMGGYDGATELRAQLGKYKAGGGCFHIRRLTDVHMPTLTKMITRSVKHLKKKEKAGG